VLSTTRLSEIGDRTQLGIHRSRSIPSRIQTVNGLLRVVFIFKTSIHISNQVISNVIADMHFLEFAVFAEFRVKVFVKGVKVLLDLLFIEGVSRSMFGIMVDVSAEDCLRVVWFDVLSRTTFAVTTGADFVIERTVDFVLLCSEDVSNV
jgi:hypothetical protein